MKLNDRIIFVIFGGDRLFIRTSSVFLNF